MRKDLSVVQGERFQRYIYRRYQGALTDLTGWQMRGHIRRSQGSTTLAATFTFVLEPDPETEEENRRFSMYLLPAETAAFRPGTYWYDVETLQGGDAQFIEKTLWGKLTVFAEVTI